MGHHHEHDDDRDITEMSTPTFWDEHYGKADAIWSGNPNPRLVEHVADLSPGTALDVGSGEGADAIWLASQGWEVTGIDISTVALDRAALIADSVGPEVAGRITWEQADVLTWEPAPRSFDLVSAQFLHLPSAVRGGVHRRLAAAVAPGGTLLVVAHHPSDLETTMRRPKMHDLFFTADEVAAELDPELWESIVAEAPGREAIDPDGQQVSIRDTVLLATRRS